MILFIVSGCDIAANLEFNESEKVNQRTSVSESSNQDENPSDINEPEVEDNADNPEGSISDEDEPTGGSDEQESFDPEPKIKGYVVGSEGYLSLIHI